MTPELMLKLQNAIAEGWQFKTHYVGDSSIAVHAVHDLAYTYTATYSAPGDSIVPCLASVIDDIDNDRLMDSWNEADDPWTLREDDEDDTSRD